MNDKICSLMAENGNLKALLSDMLPDMEARVKGLIEAWPGREVLAACHRNEGHVRRMKAFLKDSDGTGYCRWCGTTVREYHHLGCGNSDTIAEHLRGMLADGITQCPLCGETWIHTHSPREIVIYRNGIKYGRSIEVSAGVEGHES